MAYALIAKLEKFTSEKDNAQVWLNDVKKVIAANGWNDTRAMQAIPYFLQNTANSWYQSLVNKLQDFNAFKIEFLRYFSNNNSINRLQTPSLLSNKEKMKQLCSSILQHIHPIYSINLQAAITNARDFEAAEFEANHAQAINLVMNRSSKLDSKLKQFSDFINQKLEGYLADNHAIYQPSQ
ncbi:hypothetical protein G9A89_007923 [Geosiphon pyriformis]|nr:hypothetical protein G9A89_007923 [Geosiphon pyriformis]